jgi:hypothetical protein
MRARHRFRFTACVRRILPLAAAFAALLCVVTRSSAQDDDIEIIKRTAAEIAASVSSSSHCSIELRGAPRFDGAANAWLVAYMATGESCDASGDELRRLGNESALIFFRRPDSNQVRVLIANIRASVVPAFHCPISLRGDPRFDDGSGYWTVTFLASGPGCGDAAVELSRLGADYQIQFQQIQLQSALPREGILP